MNITETHSPSDSSNDSATGYSRRGIIAACFLAILLFGVCIALLGVVLPSLMEEFRINKTEAGSLFSWMSVGMLIGSLCFGPVADRYGYKALLIVNSLLMLLGLELLALTTVFAWLPVAMLLIGLGGGVINGGTSALVADLCEGRRSSGLSWLGVFFGLGALIVPILFGSLSESMGYRTLIAACGGATLLPAALFLGLSFPAPKNAHGTASAEIMTLLRQPLLLLFGAVLFFQSGLEMTLSGWSATLIKEELHIEPAQAVLYLSTYWLAMMSIRILLPPLLRIAPRRALLPFFLLFTLAGSLLMIRSDSLTGFIVGLTLIGFGLSPIFPLVLGMVGDRYTSASGTAFSICMVMALSGATTLPWLAGILGDLYGLRLSLSIVPLSLLLQGLLYFLAIRLLSRLTSQDGSRIE